MKLTQIVPRLGPMDGVGDYATVLAEALRRRHGVASRFVEAGGANGRGAFLGRLREAESGSALLLHYVGYGYAPRGAPVWLARAIARARRERPMRLGVVFHELYATGKPWQSSFWLGWAQKRVASGIARHCDGALLTRQASREWLERTGALAGKPVSVLPICSNVGEPASVPPFHDRAPSLVVWGSAAVREKIYGPWWPRVLDGCNSLGVSKVVDVGPPVKLPDNGKLAVDARGQLPAAALGLVLLEARFGLLAYPASFLAKSSIFAAHAAHGVVPLLIDDTVAPDMDDLIAGRSFLRLGRDGVAGSDKAAEVAQHARDWYSSHTAADHANAVVHMLGGPSA
jgi:hypothetical protein